MLYKCAILSLCIMFIFYFFFLHWAWDCSNITLFLSLWRNALQHPAAVSLSHSVTLGWCFCLTLIQGPFGVFLEVSCLLCQWQHIKKTITKLMYKKVSADSPCSCLWPLNLGLSKMTLYLLTKCSSTIIHGN